MSDGTIFSQGDIVLIPFPYSDLTGAKQRPALIVSNERLKGEDKVCCLITSANPKEGVSINKNHLRTGKLPFKSWVKPQRIFTVNTKIIRKRIGTINKEFHNIVLDTLDSYLESTKL